MVRIAQDQEVHPINDANVLSPRKRQKVDIPEESSTALEATESSILDWLKNYDEGVSSARANPFNPYLCTN
jgi:ATP-dependent DNA helicase RecQ